MKASGRHTIVAKSVDNKLAAVRRCNKLNDMWARRQVVSVTMPRVACLVCEGRLTKQQG
jgi:hypothetical protein